MKKFLLCGLVFASVLMGESNATSTSTNDGIVKVDEGANMTPLPTDNEVWKTAPLDTAPIAFNMFVTGNCAARKDADLIITGSMEVPDFFTVVDGKFVFKKPAPMATIQVPEGFTTYLTITLEGVTNKTGFNDNIQNYVALGVREQTAAEGTYAAMLNVSSKASECFYVDSKNTLELVPLISKTDMSSGEYTAVTAGDAITTCPALSGYADTSFDFGAIFGVKTECGETASLSKISSWEKQNWTGGCRGAIFCANGVLFSYSEDSNSSHMYLCYLDNNTWIKAQTQFSSAVSAVCYNDRSKEYIAITLSAEVYVSKNKDSWIGRDDIEKDDIHCNIASAVKLGEKIIAVDYGDYFCTLSYEDKKWSPPLSFPIEYDPRRNVGICCGDGVFMAASNDGHLAITDTDSVNWIKMDENIDIDDGVKGICGLAFGKDGFLALHCSGNLKVSANKGGSWQCLENISSEWVEIVDNRNFLDSLVNDGDAFYAIDGGGNVYRSFSVADFIDLTKKS